MASMEMLADCADGQRISNDGITIHLIHLVPRRFVASENGGRSLKCQVERKRGVYIVVKLICISYMRMGSNDRRSCSSDIENDYLYSRIQCLVL